LGKKILTLKSQITNKYQMTISKIPVFERDGEFWGAGKNFSYPQLSMPLSLHQYAIAEWNLFILKFGICGFAALGF